MYVDIALREAWPALGTAEKRVNHKLTASKLILTRLKLVRSMEAGVGGCEYNRIRFEAPGCLGSIACLQRLEDSTVVSWRKDGNLYLKLKQLNKRCRVILQRIWAKTTHEPAMWMAGSLNHPCMPIITPFPPEKSEPTPRPCAHLT